MTGSTPARPTGQALGMSAPLPPPRTAVVDAVGRALAEDLEPLGDVTSSLLPPDLEATARFVVRTDGVVAGCDWGAPVFWVGVPVDWVSWLTEVVVKVLLTLAPRLAR